jgi:hypothetical protein
MEHCKSFVEAYAARIDARSEDDAEKTFTTKLTS